MKSWVSFNDKEYKQIWKKVYKNFKFKPSIAKFPSFKVPYPFITYDISDYFGESLPGVDTYDDLEEKALLAFKENTLAEEYILALNWQHDCYWVNPRLKFERDEFGEWTIPIFPDGDYYFFIQKDFKWGFLGHPWEQSITIFGKDLISTFDKHKPIMFREILRRG
ncbi:DUF2716 domain-containing protein [Priestia aryabhattai]|uniref:DUF2716 domain-containing protein n=1 Tax=Priestia aryabhattai TaxID=412384 RepID=UPI001C8CF64D|nr:DUF2716 domain-containing protein [Priestia aryabhattai]MBY0214567.1 DUF2716 domain-containing protein [Priestia aryabhattai]